MEQRRSKDGKSSAFENILRRRTEQALAQRQVAFAEEHRQDTEEDLVAYLKDCARQIGHAPNEGEVLGGVYLTARLGSWERALELAGLGRPGKIPEYHHRKIYKEEKQHQLELWRAEKQQKEAERETRRRLRAQKKERQQEQQTPASAGEKSEEPESCT